MSACPRHAARRMNIAGASQRHHLRLAHSPALRAGCQPCVGVSRRARAAAPRASRASSPRPGPGARA
eukprot:scaffold50131_cov27-Tisochrysis_lutea.AAC.4